MEHIQHLLHPVVAGILRQAPFSEEKLVCAWHMAVGAELARVSRVQVTAGVLKVTLDDGRWQQELERSRALILERLQAVLGPDVVCRLQFMATSPPATSGARPAARRPRGRHRTEP